MMPLTKRSFYLEHNKSTWNYLGHVNKQRKNAFALTQYGLKTVQWNSFRPFAFAFTFTFTWSGYTLRRVSFVAQDYLGCGSTSLDVICFFLAIVLPRFTFYKTNATRMFVVSRQWRIQDFPEDGAPTPEGGNILFNQFSHEFCMNMKKFWSRGGGHAPRLQPRSTTTEVIYLVNLSRSKVISGD